MCVCVVLQVYLTLLLQWAGYWLWAVYLSNVLPNEVGARRPWNYCLTPSYWRPRPTDTTAALQQLLADEAAVRLRLAGWLCWGGEGRGWGGQGSSSRRTMQVSCCSSDECMAPVHSFCWKLLMLAPVNTRLLPPVLPPYIPPIPCRGCAGRL